MLKIFPVLQLRWRRSGTLARPQYNAWNFFPRDAVCRIVNAKTDCSLCRGENFFNGNLAQRRPSDGDERAVEAQTSLGRSYRSRDVSFVASVTEDESAERVERLCARTKGCVSSGRGSRCERRDSGNARSVHDRGGGCTNIVYRKPAGLTTGGFLERGEVENFELPPGYLPIRRGSTSLSVSHRRIPPRHTYKFIIHLTQI